MPSWNASLLVSLLAPAFLTLGIAGAARAQESHQEQVPAATDVAVTPPAEARDVASLLAGFARVQGLEATFVESKSLALLAAPLTTRGRLYYLRPGHLTRVVDGVQPTWLRISPSALHMEGPEGEQSIDLSKNADLRLFVTSVVKILAGDHATLEQSYELEFTPLDTPKQEPATRDDQDAAEGAALDAATPPQAWTLKLTPRAKPLTEMLRRLTLRGRGFLVETIELTEENGDTTLTTIQQAETERRFSKQERADLFGLEP